MDLRYGELGNASRTRQLPEHWPQSNADTVTVLALNIMGLVSFGQLVG